MYWQHGGSSGGDGGDGDGDGGDGDGGMITIYFKIASKL